MLNDYDAFASDRTRLSPILEGSWFLSTIFFSLLHDCSELKGRLVPRPSLLVANVIHVWCCIVCLLILIGMSLFGCALILQTVDGLAIMCASKNEIGVYAWLNNYNGGLKQRTDIGNELLLYHPVFGAMNHHWALFGGLASVILMPAIALVLFGTRKLAHGPRKYYYAFFFAFIALLISSASVFGTFARGGILRSHFTMASFPAFFASLALLFLLTIVYHDSRPTYFNLHLVLPNKKMDEEFPPDKFAQNKSLRQQLARSPKELDNSMLHRSSSVSKSLFFPLSA